MRLVGDRVVPSLEEREARTTLRLGWLTLMARTSAYSHPVKAGLEELTHAPVAVPTLEPSVVLLHRRLLVV